MNLSLHAHPRIAATWGGLKKLRAEGSIPAVLYGHSVGSKSVMLSYREFEKMYVQAGTSNLIDLQVEGEKQTVPVLIADIQRDPLNGKIIHVDLRAVRMDEKLRTEISLTFVGESPAVKSLGGNLIIGIDTLHVECLPKDLVSSIEVDISGLAELDASLHVSDLKIPEGITVLDDMAGSVVSVLAPRAEEEAPTPETVVAGAETAKTPEEASAETSEATGKE